MKIWNLFVSLIIVSSLMGCDKGASGAKHGLPPKSPEGPENPEVEKVIETWKVDLAGQEGHGGDAIVCFGIPLEEALVKIDTRKNCEQDEVCQGESGGPIRGGQPVSGVFWKMTEAGRNSITSAKPLEQYLAEKISDSRETLDALNRHSQEEAYQLLTRRISELPGAYSKVSKAHRILGWIEESGIADDFGLIDIDDSGFATGIDTTKCKELQAVVRRDNQLWYDPDIFSHFDNAGKVLIQLHEEVYWWGVKADELNQKMGYSNHQSSTPTRRFLLKLLGKNTITDILNENLQILGFSVLYMQQPQGEPIPRGKYMTSQICTAEFRYLAQFFESPYSVSHFDFKSLVEQRYLLIQNATLWQDLTYNYPEEFKEFIEFVLWFSGNDQQFYDEAKERIDEFDTNAICYSSIP